MKKTVLLIIIYLLPCISMADEYPWVQKILSKDSTVWILVNKNGDPDSILYKINFGDQGKIYWSEEQDYTVFDSLNCENEKRLKKTNLILDSLDNANNTKSKRPGPLDNNWWSIEQEWSEIERTKSTFLCYRHSATWKRKVYQLSTNLLSVLHAERGRGKIWVGGLCFVGYYYNEVFIRLFFIDDYELQGTHPYIDEDCLEEKEPNPEDYNDSKDYEEALGDYNAMIGGDSHPPSICFCDGRKIGYIQSENGYVNFSAKPDDVCPSSTGIILDRVRVFYWDDENNPDWYRVEINGVTGYVRKNCIIAG